MEKAEGPGGPVPRRRLLRTAGAAGIGVLVVATVGQPQDGGGATTTRTAGHAGGATAVEAAVGSLEEPEIALVLEVGRAGAVYPVAFPDFGEPGPATARVTRQRLLARLPAVKAPRLGLVRRGAADLIATGLPGAGTDRMLDGIGRAVAMAGPDGFDATTAVVALAIATVSKKFDPMSDRPAALWLDTVRRRHLRRK